MSPLVDIDANCRVPGFKAPQLPAKAHSPMAPPSTSSKHDRNPFRVSASGSPRYMAYNLSPMTGLSPTVGSKIPRKAGSASLPSRSRTELGARSLAGSKAATGRLSAIPVSSRTVPLKSILC
jgi:hypothetical protein